MQVLFDLGVEHGERTEGCGQWPGTVERLEADVLPHMGWNTVRSPTNSTLFAGLDADTRFYSCTRTRCGAGSWSRASRSGHR